MTEEKDYGLLSFNTVKYLHTNEGQITSPGYPDNYPNNVSFTWIIRTRRNDAYEAFIILDMDIACGDYLKIEQVEPCCFNAFYGCSNRKIHQRTVYTKGKHFRISFLSDKRLSAKGFNISWTAKLGRKAVSKATRLTITPTRTVSTTKALTSTATITTINKLTATPTTRTTLSIIHLAATSESKRSEPTGARFLKITLKKFRPNNVQGQNL
ncbi:protein SpAN-like [Saccostrea echinata]|uniref:protein SpAN-like n=1 Tax=Saccostrea echinata TaxID=191078 RepID=UPI002A838288|nr:protein SpAN-like [Saccostrea echinata]